MLHRMERNMERCWREMRDSLSLSTDCAREIQDLAAERESYKLRLQVIDSDIDSVGRIWRVY